MLAALAEVGWIAQTNAIDSTYVKAHRCAHRGRGGRKTRLSDHHGAGRPPRSTCFLTTLGRPAVVHLTSGNSSDVRTAPDVLAGRFLGPSTPMDPADMPRAGALALSKLRLSTSTRSATAPGAPPSFRAWFRRLSGFYARKMG